MHGRVKISGNPLDPATVKITCGGVLIPARTLSIHISANDVGTARVELYLDELDLEIPFAELTKESDDGDSPIRVDHPAARG